MQGDAPRAGPARDSSPRPSSCSLVALGVRAFWLGRAPIALPERARSVLLITVDTLRADAVGAYGKADAGTPWMDRLAAGGVRFDDAHAHNVLTLPSHANILSGRYPLDHGVRDNAGFRFPAGIDTLATLLKARGYATGAFVSAFPLDARFGLDRGFDVYDDSFVGRPARPAFLEQERARNGDGGPGPAMAGRAGRAPVLLLGPPLRAALSVRAAGAFASRFTGRSVSGRGGRRRRRAGPAPGAAAGRG